jgi:hypothetical protein
MAKMSSISRLYGRVKSATVADSLQAEPQVKLPNCGLDPQLPPAPSLLELQARYEATVGRRRRGPAAGYGFGDNTIMSTVTADMPMDRAGRFEMLAERDRLLQLGRRLGVRWRGHAI